MARIETVNYELMPKMANEMRGEAIVLNNELNLAYQNINNMREVWYGIRFNELVDSFNNMIPAINEMLTLVVTEIPYSLETIANNYAQADSGRNVVTPNNEGPKTINNLLKSDAVGMRFLTSEVSDVKQKVSINFTNARESMDKIETIYSKVVWESEASQAFKAKFKALKDQISTSFENINTQFKKLMEQAEQDMERTEKANTVN